MSLPCLARTSQLVIRRNLAYSALRRATAAASTTPDSSIPPPPNATASSSSPAGLSGSAKVQHIVDQIAALTLLEAADLVQALKTRLNIADVPLVAAAAPAAAPTAAAGQAAPKVAEEEDEAPAEKPKEKTMFKVVLKAIDASQKAKVIKEIKAAISGMNLVEAKKFVESAPQTVKDNVPKEDAEKLRKALEAAGATVELE